MRRCMGRRFMLAGLVVLSCDTEYFPAPPSAGPRIHLVPFGTNVGPGSSYTVDQPVRLAFDRFLDPTTVTPQAVALEDSAGVPVSEARLAYDPVTLTVTLSNPGGSLVWLTPGKEYRVVLSTDTTHGLLAIDGAPLAVPMTILFTPGAPPRPPFAGVPTMHFCADLLGPVLLGSCAYGTCHVTPPDAGARAPLDSGQSEPPQGLSLGNQHWFRATALGYVAHESNTGPRGVVRMASRGQFGIDMAIIAPGNPGSSWLMYKTLLASPAPAAEAGTGPASGVSTFGQGVVSPVSSAERARLSNYILGREMPYPSAPSQSEPSVGLAVADLERLSAWISQGAQADPACP